MTRRTPIECLAPLACLGLAGCPGSVPAPPAAAWPLDGIRQEPSGSTSVMVFGGAAAVPGGSNLGTFGLGYAGGRVAHRFSARTSVGIDGASSLPTGLGAGRLFVRLDAPGEFLAVTAGVGGGGLGTAPYATLDLGVRAGGLTRGRVFEYYVAVGGSESLAIARAFGERGLLTTYGLSGDVGAILHPAPAWGIGLDVFGTYVIATRGADFALLGATLSVRWTFGGVAAPRTRAGRYGAPAASR